MRGLACVDDAAIAMYIVETEEDLLCYLFDHAHGDAFVLMTFDEAEEVLAEDFEYHAYVSAIRAFVAKVIEERDDV